jgi:hypothetical protein
MDINSNDIHFDNSCSFKNGILPDRNVSANAGSIFLQLTSIQSSHVHVETVVLLCASSEAGRC